MGRDRPGEVNLQIKKNDAERGNDRTMDIWTSIRAEWERYGPKVPAGVTSDELAEFEQRYNVALPREMREYFQVANGNGGLGGDLFNFWPLNEVKLVSEELTSPVHTDRLDYPQCFVFAD